MSAPSRAALVVALLLAFFCFAIEVRPARAADAGPPAPQGACVEQIPSGAQKPKIVERVPTRVKAGELITLEIVVEHGSGESATVPADLPQLIVKSENGEVRVADDGSFGRGIAPVAKPLADDKSKATTILEIPFVVLSTSLVRAKFTLPAVRVIVLRKGGGDISVCTATHVVDVDQPIANDPDPWPRPNPASMPQKTRDTRTQELVQWGILGALAGAVIVAALIYYLRRPKVAPPPPAPHPPWTIAIAELGAARSEFLAGKLHGKHYYDRLSDVVRVYLGKLYGFDGLDMTSDELLARIRRLVTPVPIDDVRTFLGMCDLVKFAGMSASQEEGTQTADLAMYLVRVTSPHGGGGLRPPRPSLTPEPEPVAPREVEEPRFIEADEEPPPPPPAPPAPPQPPEGGDE